MELLLNKKFRYYDIKNEGTTDFATFSKVMRNFNIVFDSRASEQAIFSEIRNEQMRDGLISGDAIDFHHFTERVLGLNTRTKSARRLPSGTGSNRNNRSSYQVTNARTGQAPNEVSQRDYDLALQDVSNSLCHINLVYVLDHVNAEMKANYGDRKIDYKGLLRCFMKIGLGFQFEVNFDFIFVYFIFFCEITEFYFLKFHFILFKTF